MTCIRPVADVERDQFAVLTERSAEGMGINNAGFWSAVAAGYIDRRISRKLLQKRNGRKLRESPCIRHAHKDIHTSLAELLRNNSACASPSTSTVEYTTGTAVLSGITTAPLMTSAAIFMIFWQRRRLSLSIRGSPVAKTPITGAFGIAFLILGRLTGLTLPFQFSFFHRQIFNKFFPPHNYLATICNEGHILQGREYQFYKLHNLDLNTALPSVHI